MGEGGVKTPEKLPTSFMDGPFLRAAIVLLFFSNNAFTYCNGVILFYGFAWQKSQKQMDACPWPEFIAWLPFFSCINDNGTFFLARSRAFLFGAYKNIAIFFALFFSFPKNVYYSHWILLC